MSSNKDDFHVPRSSRETGYLGYSENISHATKIAAVFAINYVATIKGQCCDIEKTEKMVFDKKFETYEKKYHPVYLKFIMRENSTMADLVLQRMNSNNVRTITAYGVKIDSKNVAYFYLSAKDVVDVSITRVLVFSIIHNGIMKDIRANMPDFGSNKDMQQNGYSVPNDLSTVVRYIQLYCLPSLGHFVSEMREKMASPLKKIFNKKGSITKISERNGSMKSKRNSGTKLRRSSKKSENLQDSPSRKTIPNINLSFKSKSIESLLLSNVDIDNLIVDFGINQKSTSNADLPNSLSTQSSLNEDKSNDSSNPLFIKFEDLLYDERGLKYFKDFLTKEVSSENILFWEAVRDFIKIDNPDLMKSKAADIFYTYVDEDSDTAVNLECDVVEQARNLLNEPHIDMFNAARNHIFYLMKTDKFYRFRKSYYFDLWHEEYKNDWGLTHASSTSSLTQSKKRHTFLPNIFKIKKEKQKKEDSRKSSQTLDSDGGSSNISTNCKITMALDFPEIHCIQVQSQKKLIQVLKKIDKHFSENVTVVFDQSDNKIVPFSENMANLAGRRIIVEKSVVIRVGFVQINMDVNLLEYVWYVIRPRYHLGLSHALDPVAKRVGVDLSHCVVLKEEEHLPVEWDTEIYHLNKCSLFLVEHDVFRKAKFYGKSTSSSLDLLWKRVINGDSFLLTLPFDDDNILDSRNEVFTKYKLEPRRVGYIMAGSILLRDQLDSTITRAHINSYDDQRGLCTDAQLVLPDFLNSMESDELSSVSSKRHSEVFFGDSDLSFSELDESSDPSPSKLELVSDLD